MWPISLQLVREVFETKTRQSLIFVILQKQMIIFEQPWLVKYLEI